MNTGVNVLGDQWSFCGWKKQWHEHLKNCRKYHGNYSKFVYCSSFDKPRNLEFINIVEVICSENRMLRMTC